LRPSPERSRRPLSCGCQSAAPDHRARHHPRSGSHARTTAPQHHRALNFTLLFACLGSRANAGLSTSKPQTPGNCPSSAAAASPATANPPSARPRADPTARSRRCDGGCNGRPRATRLPAREKPSPLSQDRPPSSKLSPLAMLLPFSRHPARANQHPFQIRRARFTPTSHPMACQLVPFHLAFGP